MTTGISSTTRFIVACCYWPQESTTKRAISLAAQKVTDWTAVFDSICRHRVEPQVYRAIHDHPDVPQKLKNQLKPRARQIAISALHHAQETHRLTQELRKAGLSGVHIKGITLEELIYAERGYKHSKDIDLYVPKAQAEAAIEVFEALGYRLLNTGEILPPRLRQAIVRNKKDIELQHPSGVILEVHWRLAAAPHLLRGLETRLDTSLQRGSDQTQDVLLPEIGPVQTLSDDNLFAYLCVHGALHDWARLKWLVDVAGYWQGFTPQAQQQRIEAAQAMGAGIAVRQALDLIETLFDIPAPPPAQHVTQSARQRSEQAALLRHGLARIEASYAPTSDNLWIKNITAIRMRFTHIRLHDRKRDALSVFQPISVALPDMIAFPLPPALNWLYWVIRAPSFLIRRGYGMVSGLFHVLMRASAQKHDS